MKQRGSERDKVVRVGGDKRFLLSVLVEDEISASELLFFLSVWENVYKVWLLASTSSVPALLLYRYLDTVVCF